MAEPSGSRSAAAQLLTGLAVVALLLSVTVQLYSLRAPGTESVAGVRVDVLTGGLFVVATLLVAVVAFLPLPSEREA